MKKSVITFSLATALLLSGVTLPIINTVDAASQKQVVQSINSKHQTTLNHIKQLAPQGKTINSENFALQSKAKDIVKKWGKPDHGSDTYLYYEKRGMDFDIRKGKVVKIFSTDKSYRGITYKEVKQVYGEPAKEFKGADGYYMIYKAGKNTLELGFHYNHDRTKLTTLGGVNVF